MDYKKYFKEKLAEVLDDKLKNLERNSMNHLKEIEILKYELNDIYEDNQDETFINDIKSKKFYFTYFDEEKNLNFEIQNLTSFSIEGKPPKPKPQPEEKLQKNESNKKNNRTMNLSFNNMKNLEELLRQKESLLHYKKNNNSSNYIYNSMKNQNTNRNYSNNNANSNQEKFISGSSTNTLLGNLSINNKICELYKNLRKNNNNKFNNNSNNNYILNSHTNYKSNKNLVFSNSPSEKKTVSKIINNTLENFSNKKQPNKNFINNYSNYSTNNNNNFSSALKEEPLNKYANHYKLGNLNKSTNNLINRADLNYNTASIDTNREEYCDLNKNYSTNEIGGAAGMETKKRFEKNLSDINSIDIYDNSPMSNLKDNVVIYQSLSPKDRKITSNFVENIKEKISVLENIPPSNFLNNINININHLSTNNSHENLKNIANGNIIYNNGNLVENFISVKRLENKASRKHTDNVDEHELLNSSLNNNANSFNNLHSNLSFCEQSLKLQQNNLINNLHLSNHQHLNHPLDSEIDIDIELNKESANNFHTPKALSQVQFPDRNQFSQVNSLQKNNPPNSQLTSQYAGSLNNNSNNNYNSNFKKNLKSNHTNKTKTQANSLSIQDLINKRLLSHQNTNKHVNNIKNLVLKENKFNRILEHSFSNALNLSLKLNKEKTNYFNNENLAADENSRIEANEENILNNDSNSNNLQENLQQKAIPATITDEHQKEKSTPNKAKQFLSSHKKTKSVNSNNFLMNLHSLHNNLFSNKNNDKKLSSKLNTNRSIIKEKPQENFNNNKIEYSSQSKSKDKKTLHENEQLELHYPDITEKIHLKTIKKGVHKQTKSHNNLNFLQENKSSNIIIGENKAEKTPMKEIKYNNNSKSNSKITTKNMLQKPQINNFKKEANRSLEIKTDFYEEDFEKKESYTVRNINKSSDKVFETKNQSKSPTYNRNNHIPNTNRLSTDLNLKPIQKPDAKEIIANVDCNIHNIINQEDEEKDFSLNEDIKEIKNCKLNENNSKNNKTRNKGENKSINNESKNKIKRNRRSNTAIIKKEADSKLSTINQEESQPIKSNYRNSQITNSKNAFKKIKDKYKNFNPLKAEENEDHTISLFSTIKPRNRSIIKGNRDENTNSTKDEINNINNNNNINNSRKLSKLSSRDKISNNNNREKAEKLRLSQLEIESKHINSIHADSLSELININAEIQNKNGGDIEAILNSQSEAENILLNHSFHSLNGNFTNNEKAKFKEEINKTIEKEIKKDLLINDISINININVKEANTEEKNYNEIINNILTDENNFSNSVNNTKSLDTEERRFPTPKFSPLNFNNKCKRFSFTKEDKEAKPQFVLKLLMKSSYLPVNKTIEIIKGTRIFYEDIELIESVKINYLKLTIASKQSFITDIIGVSNIDALGEAFEASKISKNGLSLFTKSEEHDLLNKDQPIEIVHFFKFVGLVFGTKIEEEQECEQNNKNFIQFFFQKFFPENANIKNTLIDLSSKLHLISEEKYEEIIKFVEEHPEVINSTGLLRKNRSCSYISFLIKEIYDYFTIKANDGYPIFRLRNLYQEIKKLRYELDKLEAVRYDKANNDKACF